MANSAASSLFEKFYPSSDFISIGVEVKFLEKSDCYWISYDKWVWSWLLRNLTRFEVAQSNTAWLLQNLWFSFIYIHICMYTYIYIRIYMLCIYVSCCRILALIHIHIYIYVYIRIHMNIWIYMYVCREREREREGESGRRRLRLYSVSALFKGFLREREKAR